MPGGRPEIVLDIAEVERLAGLGFIDQQIADVLGISLATLKNKKKKHSEFLAAINRGKARSNDKVTSALYRKATEDGDTAACIFWLKNRMRDQWRDKWAEDEPAQQAPINIVVGGPGGAGPSTDND